MKRLVVFVAFLFLASDVFAQAAPVIRAFSRVAPSNATSLTQSNAARTLISNGARAGVVNLSALSSVTAFEAAVSTILNSNNAGLRNQASNLLKAVEDATEAIRNGSLASSEITKYFDVSKLGISTAAQELSLRVGSTTSTGVVDAQAVATFDVKLDSFANAVKVRSSRTGNTTLVSRLDEAVSEMKTAARHGVFVLGDGASECVEKWGDESDPQVANLVGVFASTDNATTYSQAFNNISSGAKEILGVASNEEIARRLGVLSNPDGCRALSPRVSSLAQ